MIGGYEEEEKLLETFLKSNKVDFVISNLFSPYVAQLTYELEIKYAVYGMDSPMYETYISHDNERIKIGIKGYKKVKDCYTYEQQLNKIISVLFPAL